MAASDQGIAPARARPRAAVGELREREEGWQLAMRERPQPGTGIGEVGRREQESVILCSGIRN